MTSPLSKVGASHARACAVALSLTASSVAQAAPLRVTQDEIRAWTDELVPLIEREVGVGFVRAPRVELADQPEVREALVLQGQQQALAFFAGQPAERVHRWQKAQTDLLANGVMGFCRFAESILLVPQHVQVQLELRGCDRGLARDVLRLVLAHELVHELQDQVAGVGERLRVTVEGEALAGLGALLEGHATMVHGRIARRLGLHEAADAMRVVMVSDHDNGADGDFLARYSRGSGNFAYASGCAFAEKHHAEGGHGRLWEILRGRPPSSGMILRPATYRAEWQPSVELDGALEGLEVQLGVEHWLVGRGSLPESGIRSTWSHADAGELDAVLGELRAARRLEAWGSTPFLQMHVHLLAFADAASAARFVALAVSSLSAECAAVQKAHPASKGELTRDDETGWRCLRVQIQRDGTFIRLREELGLRAEGRHVLYVNARARPLRDAVLRAVSEVVSSRLR